MWEESVYDWYGRYRYTNSLGRVYGNVFRRLPTLPADFLIETGHVNKISVLKSSEVGTNLIIVGFLHLLHKDKTLHRFRPKSANSQ